MFWPITGLIFALIVGALWLYEHKNGRRYRIDQSHRDAARARARARGEYEMRAPRRFWGPPGGGLGGM